jgi:3-isopropylmalate dehydratase small subunit
VIAGDTASPLDTVHEGRVWKFGASVDTTQLAGGGLAGRSPEDSLRINCLRGLRPEFAEDVRPGDILVAGRNFGCGSSRQQAVTALQLCGISVVLAESVARIHRRNSISFAFPTLSVPGISELVEDGDTVVVDYRNGVVTNSTRGGELALARLSPRVEEIYAAGGLSSLVAARLAAMGYLPDHPEGLESETPWTPGGTS